MYKENIKTKIFNPGSEIYKSFQILIRTIVRTKTRLRVYHAELVTNRLYINAAKLLFFITGFNAL